MSRSRRECELLRPVLVAFVHGEHHPETSRLDRHLRRCAACRRERSALEQTLAVLQGIPFTRPQPRARTRGVPWLGASRREALLQAMTVCAGILVAAMLIWGSKSPPAKGPEDRNGLEPSVAAASPRENGAVLADFGGGSLDAALDRFERRLESLGGVW